MGLIETIAEMVPRLNKTYGKDGRINKNLMAAFQKVGFPCDGDNFPGIVFDQSIKSLSLALAFPYKRFWQPSRLSLFQQLDEVTIPVQAIYELLGERFDPEWSQVRTEFMVLGASLMVASWALVEEIAGHQDDETLSTQILASVMQALEISPITDGN